MDFNKDVKPVKKTPATFKLFCVELNVMCTVGVVWKAIRYFVH